METRTFKTLAVGTLITFALSNCGNYNDNRKDTEHKDDVPGPHGSYRSDTNSHTVPGPSTEKGIDPNRTGNNDSLNRGR
ncbi:MAG TPA: hypothetical protein VI112_17855 [Bacteroidia bacterium]|jgi:hypothetical protein